MRLAAITYGYGVAPDEIAGSVVAVFAHACEILCTSGRLVTLATRGGGLPGGIAVDAPEEFRFDAAIATGVEAATRSGILRFAGSAHSVDMRRARPWHSRIRGLRLNLVRPSSRRSWLEARDALCADGRAAPLIAIGRAALDDLALASLELDYVGARDAAARLIGLGDGTTPAGDDCLVGHLGGVWACTCGRAERIEFAGRFGANLAALAPRTHRASRAYLEAAAVAELSERMTDVAAAIVAGDETVARRAAMNAIAVGHSSGACSVLGLLLGIASLYAADVARGLLDIATA